MNLHAILALFIRSVREDVRARSLVWARLGIAAATLVAVMFAHAAYSFYGAPGLAFFRVLVWMNVIFITVAGMSYFASAITEEKEEGTLGLLRMANLSPFAILMGKSTSRLIGGLMLILVQLPFALLAITLGGVHLSQVLASYAILCAYLVFACNVGLLASVLSPRTGAAGLVAAGLGAMLLLALPNLLDAFGARSWAQNFQLSGALRAIFASRVETGAAPLVTGLLGSSVALLLLARISFEPFCGEGGAAGTLGGGRKAQQGGRVPRSWSDAIFWRDYFFLHGGNRVAIIKFVIYVGAALWMAWVIFDRPTGAWRSTMERRIQDFSLSLFFASCAVAMLESLVATSRIYRLECKERTISGLILLPQELDDLIASKRRALLRSLIPALTFVITSGIVTAAYAVAHAGEQLIWIIQGLALVVAQIYFNHSLVAWFSLRVKWGGLPLALGVSWIGNCIAAVLAGLIFNVAAFIILIFASVALHVSLKSAFKDRLLAAGAKD